jgi:hypothetical protein
MLHADIAPAGAHRLVERIVIGHGAELLAIARAKTLDHGIVEQHLVDRLEDDRVEGTGGALSERIEAAQPIQRVTEEIESQRRRRARGKEVDDAAADGELARLTHRVGPGIAVPGEKAGQAVERDAAAATQRQDAVLEKLARRHALDDGVHRRQHHPARARRRGLGQPGQCVDAPAHNLGIGRGAVVRQAIPGRQGNHLDAGLEEGQRRRGARQPTVVAADMEEARHRVARHQAAQDESVVAFGRAGDGDAASRRRRVGGKEAVERAHAGLGR